MLDITKDNITFHFIRNCIVCFSWNLAIAIRHFICQSEIHDYIPIAGHLFSVLIINSFIKTSRTRNHKQ